MREAEVLDKIADIPAHTAEGRRAKARSLLIYDEGELLSADPPGLTERLTASLIRDVIGGRGMTSVYA